jgi:hypothetical protein
MEMEFSNFNERAIPKSCPAELRSKIEAARAGKKPEVKQPELSVEQDAETLKAFAATLGQ